MRLHKLKASDSSGTYLIESPVTETDILLMARQLASLRLRRGRALTSPKEVFGHLQALLGDYEHEVFALLLLDSRHRVIVFHELFRGTLDSASVYPREVVKTALEHNAAATVLVHNHPSGEALGLRQILLLQSEVRVVTLGCISRCAANEASAASLATIETALYRLSTTESRRPVYFFDTVNL